MGEVSVLDTAFDGMLEAMKAGNREELMKLSGQKSDDQPKAGLSRLNINYETDTDEGHTLKKGTWKLYHDGEFIYADSVKFRPLIRTYEWSVWDQEEGKFTSRSVQGPSLDFQYPDTSGGNKCGRITKSEEQSFGEDHPLTLASRLATCNQVFYALVTMEGKTADGRSVKLEDYPVVSYFKRSGFRPAREAIDRLGKNTLMNEVVFELTTKRNKMGSVTYFTPIFTQVDTVPMGPETMEVMTMFLETVKASNANVLSQHKEAAKAKASNEEVDLAADFN